MPSLLINKQREKKKRKFTRFSRLTEKKSSALNSVKIRRMKSSSTSRMTINIILLKSMGRVSVTRRIIVQTKSRCRRVGFPSQDRPVSACHMGWWLRLSQPSPPLVIMTPLSRYKTMESSLQSWRTFFFLDCSRSEEESILPVALRCAKWTKITQRIYYSIFFRVFIKMRALLHKNFSLK